MAVISIIILTVTLLSVAVSFGVLLFPFKKNSKATNIVKVRPYNSSVKKLLNAKSMNDGETLTQKKLLRNAECVLNSFYDKL